MVPFPRSIEDVGLLKVSVQLDGSAGPSAGTFAERIWRTGRSGKLGQQSGQPGQQSGQPAPRPQGSDVRGRGHRGLCGPGPHCQVLEGAWPQGRQTEDHQGAKWSADSA